MLDALAELKVDKATGSLRFITGWEARENVAGVLANNFKYSLDTVRYQMTGGQQVQSAFTGSTERNYLVTTDL